MTQGGLSIATFDLARDAFSQLFWRSAEVKLERLTPERISFLQTVLKEEGVFQKKLVKKKHFREKKDNILASKIAAHKAALKRRREKDRLKRAAKRLLSTTTSDDSRGISSDSIHSKNDGRESSSAEEQRVKNKGNFSKITPAKDLNGGSSLNLNRESLTHNDRDKDSSTSSDVPLSYQCAVSLPTSKERTALPYSMKRKKSQVGQSNFKENKKKSTSLVSETNHVSGVSEPDRMSVIRHTQCEGSSVRDQCGTVSVQKLKESLNKSFECAARKTNTEVSKVISPEPRPPVVVPNSNPAVPQPPPHSGQKRDSIPTTHVTTTTLPSNSSTSVHANVPSATDKALDRSPPASSDIHTPASSSDGNSQDSVASVTYPRLRVKDAASLGIGIKSPAVTTQPATQQYNMPQEHLALERCLRTFAMVVADIWVQFVRLRRSYEALFTSEVSQADVRQTRVDYALLWKNVAFYKVRAVKWNEYLLSSMSRATLLKALIERVRIVVSQEGLQFSDERCLVFYNIANKDVEHFMRGTFPLMEETLAKLEAGQPLHGQTHTTQPLQGQPQSVQSLPRQAQIGQPPYGQPQTSQSNEGRTQTNHLLQRQIQNTQPFQDQSQAGLLPHQGQIQAGQSLLGQSQSGQPLLIQSQTGQSFLTPLQVDKPFLYQVLTGNPLQGQVQAGQPLLGQAQASQSLPGRAQIAQLPPGQSQAGQPLPVQTQTGQIVPGRTQTALLLPVQPQTGQSFQGGAQTVQILPRQLQAGQPLTGRAETAQMLPSQQHVSQPLPEQPQSSQVQEGPIQQPSAIRCPNITMKSELVTMRPPPPYPGLSNGTLQNYTIQYKPRPETTLPVPVRYNVSISSPFVNAMQQIPSLDTGYSNHPPPRFATTVLSQVSAVSHPPSALPPSAPNSQRPQMIPAHIPSHILSQVSAESHPSSALPPSAPNSQRHQMIPAHIPSQATDKQYQYWLSGQQQASRLQKRNTIWRQAASRFTSSDPERQRKSATEDDWNRLYPSRDSLLSDKRPGDQESVPALNPPPVARFSAYNFVPNVGYVLATDLPESVTNLPINLGGMAEGGNNILSNTEQPSNVASTVLPSTAGFSADSSTTHKPEKQMLADAECPVSKRIVAIMNSVREQEEAKHKAEKQVSAEKERSVRKRVKAILSSVRDQEKTKDNAAPVHRAESVSYGQKGDLGKRKRPVEAPIETSQEILRVAGQQNGKRVEAGGRQSEAKVLKSTQRGHEKSACDVINKSTSHLDTIKQISPATDLTANIYAEKKRVNSAVILNLDNRVTNMNVHYDRTLPGRKVERAKGVALPADPKSVQCDTTMPKNIGKVVEDTGLPVGAKVISGSRLPLKGVTLQLNKTQKCDNKLPSAKPSAARKPCPVNLAITKASAQSQSGQKPTLPGGVTPNNNITESRGIVEAQLKPVAETSSKQYCADGEFVSLSSSHVVTDRFPDKHVSPTPVSLTMPNQNASSSNIICSASAKGSVENPVVPKPSKSNGQGEHSKPDVVVTTPALAAYTTTRARVAAPSPLLPEATVGTLPSLIDQTIEKIFRSDLALPLRSSKKPNPSSGYEPSKDVPTQSGPIKKAISSTLLSQSKSQNMSPAQNANEPQVESSLSESSALPSSEERETSPGVAAKRASRYSSDASTSSERHHRPELLFVSAGCDVTEDIEDDDDDVMFVSFERNIVVVDLSDDDDGGASTVLGKSSDARVGSTGVGLATRLSPAKSTKIVPTKSSLTEVVSATEVVHTTQETGRTESDDRYADPSQPGESGGSLSCVQCGKEAQGSCSKCMATYYCSKGCMDNHWRLKHRFECAQAWSIETAASEGD